MMEGFTPWYRREGSGKSDWWAPKDCSWWGRMQQEVKRQGWLSLQYTWGMSTSVGNQSCCSLCCPGRTYDFARGDAHFWLTYPLPPPRIRIRIKILSWIRIQCGSTGLGPLFLHYLIRNCFVKRTKNTMAKTMVIKMKGTVSQDLLALSFPLQSMPSGPLMNRLNWF